MNSHIPHTVHFKMATCCICLPKWRLPFPILCSIRMARARNTQRPQPSSKSAPSPHKFIRDPHILILLCSNSFPLPWEQPGVKQLHLYSCWPWLVPSLHATQQSSCWQPPSASPPALMTFINELHSFCILMKLGESDGERTCVG